MRKSVILAMLVEKVTNQINAELVENHCDENTFNMFFKAYNNYQNEEHDGVDYIYDLDNQDDLENAVHDGMTSTHICALSRANAKYFFFNKEKKMPIPANVLGAIRANLEEIVRCSIMYPFACDGYRRIYTAYITDFMAENESDPQGQLDN